MANIRLTQNGAWTLNDLVTILQFIMLIGGIVWTVAILPQQVLSECNTRYASREKTDFIQEQLSRIESKVDLIYQNIDWRR